MTAASQPVALTCHPQTPAHAVRGITARVRRLPDALLVIAFVLEADLSRLRIPAPREARMTHGLWEHTCFEAFIALNDTPAYHEFNFAPSSEWAVYAFERYRKRVPPRDQAVAPAVHVRRLADRLELDTVVHLNSFSASHSTAALRLALSAVIEDASGSLSYWALRHPPGTPDFHHGDAFALTVDSMRDPR